MNPILFAENSTAFTTNGIGRLSDAISCDVTEERNGQYTLEMTYPVTGRHYESIAQRAIIVAKPSAGSSPQPFRIYNISRPINGIVTIDAYHISYDLSKNVVMPFSVTASASACQTTLNGLLSNAVETCPFTFSTDVNTVASYTQSAPATIKQRLGGVEGSVLDQFGGEYEWNGYTVTLHKNRGQVKNIPLRYGKNITDLKQENNISNTITGVVPYWIDSDGNNLVTLTEKVVYSPNASLYSQKLTVPLDLSDNYDEKPTENTLRTAAQAYVNQSGVGIPKVSIEVSFVNLAETEEYKDIAPLQNVNLCDTIPVQFETLGIDTTAKIVKTEYDVLAERYKKITVGSLKSNLATTITDQNDALLNEVSTKFSKVGNEINNATAWLTSSGGYVVAVKNTDGSWKELLFLDTNDIDTATNVLRINENGIGFSGSGVNGPYTQAWTLDGRLVIGGTNAPSITVYDSNNTVIFQADATAMIWNATNSSMDSTGIITMSGAKISGGYIEQTDSFGGIFRLENGVISLIYNNSSIGSVGVNADINHNAHFVANAYNTGIYNTHNCEITADNNIWLEADNLLSLSASETGGRLGIEADNVINMNCINGNVNISAGGTLDLSANAITVAGNATSSGNYVESLDTTSIEFISDLNVSYDTIYNATANLYIDFNNQSASWNNVDFTYVYDVSWTDNSMDIYDSYTTRSFIDGLAT